MERASLGIGRVGRRIYRTIRQIAGPAPHPAQARESEPIRHSARSRDRANEGTGQDREETRQDRSKAAQEILEPLNTRFNVLKSCLSYRPGLRARRFPSRCSTHNAGTLDGAVSSRGNADTRWTPPRSSFANDCGACDLWNARFDISGLPSFLLHQQNEPLRGVDVHFA